MRLKILYKDMNIVYIHQYFKTHQEPGGTRSYWIWDQYYA